LYQKHVNILQPFLTSITTIFQEEKYNHAIIAGKSVWIRKATAIIFHATILCNSIFLIFITNMKPGTQKKILYLNNRLKIDLI